MSKAETALIHASFTVVLLTRCLSNGIITVP